MVSKFCLKVGDFLYLSHPKKQFQMEPSRALLSKFSILAAFLFILISGCKKDDEYDPTDAVASDFRGTWRGTISMYKGGELVKKSGDVILYFTPDGMVLNGLMVFEQVYALEEIQFRSGVYYFQVLNSDTLNPLCTEWNLSGFMRLSDPQTAEFFISGKECGLTGKNWVDFTGTLSLVNPEPDPTAYYNFAKSGNQWNYDITQVNDQTCQMEYQLNTDLGNYHFEGQKGNTCNWNWNNAPLNWVVSPMRFSVLSDSSDAIRYSFYLDARLLSEYRFEVGDDTNIVTLLSAKENVEVPAGVFSCAKFRLEQRIHSNGYRIESGIWYLNNTAGLIKYQAISLYDSTDIKFQVLGSKNF